MNAMTHKGYAARLDFDARDGIFVGRVLGLRTIASRHGDSVAGLRAAFRSAVDEFLCDSKERGLQPEKAASGKLMLRVPARLHGAALIAAEAAGKSLNQWATEVLEEAAFG